MDKSSELPALPETDWQLYQPAGGYEPEFISTQDGFTADQMRAYALAAVEAEREACAKLCEEMAYALDNGGNPYLYDRKAIQMASKIRERGKS